MFLTEFIDADKNETPPPVFHWALLVLSIVLLFWAVYP